MNLPFAAWTNLVGWQGKTFDAARPRLVNRVTPFRIVSGFRTIAFALDFTRAQ